MSSQRIEKLNQRKEGLVDPSGALRRSYVDTEKGLTVLPIGSALVPKQFTREIMEYDVNDNISTITYYNDNIQETTNIDFIADVLGNLAGTYFNLYSGRDKKQFYVWYKVSGLGTDPAIVGATGIQVNIQNNDTAKVVMLATHSELKLSTDFYFNVTNDNTDSLEVVCKQGGVTTTTTDGTTNFTITQKLAGTSKVVGIIDFTYDLNDNVTNIEAYA